jgi:C-terminal processing protease CtpA/Prc
VDRYIPEADRLTMGLQKGDRIIKVNRLPLSRTIIEDPRAFLYGFPNTPVSVTVLRANANGADEELEFEILRPHQPHQFSQALDDPAS